MTVKVVPLPAHEGLKFDLILEDGYIVTISMNDYEVRQYRGSISDVIYAKILDWCDLNGYNVYGLKVIYC